MVAWIAFLLVNGQCQKGFHTKTTTNLNKSCNCFCLSLDCFSTSWTFRCSSSTCNVPSSVLFVPINSHSNYGPHPESQATLTEQHLSETDRLQDNKSSISADETLRLVEKWRAPWKNRISSTTMKLRKSLIKSVTWQNISSCLVLPPEIIMHDAFNVITSADICVVHDDLGWKNWTTRYNRFWRAGCSRLEYVDIRLVY